MKTEQEINALASQLETLQDRLVSLQERSQGHLSVNLIDAAQFSAMMISLQSVYATLAWLDGRDQQAIPDDQYCRMEDFLFKCEQFLNHLNSECVETRPPSPHRR
jgi:hypothetical protein